MRLNVTIPSLASELAMLLIDAEEPGLAAQVAGLEILDRCRCGDDFCATFYTQPKPAGSYDASYRNIVLAPQKGWLILDVAGDRIMCVEILYRNDIRDVLRGAVP